MPQDVDDVVTLDLFNSPTGAQLRDQGMAQAAAHANAVDAGWTERAYGFLVRVTRQRECFTMEDVREFATANGLGDPPDKRAWGAVSMRGSRAGIMSNTRTTVPGRNRLCHGRPMTLWKSSR